MGSCAAPSAKGDDKFITTDYLQQCPFFFILSLRQVGHLIARVICISLFYQNPIGFFFSILF
ncbi:hypothetical protein, partial [Acinetobacter baumannii]|uniref:hypothetical protein n=1 Tax=Acinetobacter baumannii TaxID=470 RepID=UPI0020A16E27